MKKTLQLLLILFWVLFILSSAFAAGKKTTPRLYLEKLHRNGRERVIVIFRNTINERILTRYYNVKPIRKLKTINALVCEIDKADIEPLKRLPIIKNLVPDMLITLPESQETSANQIREQQADGGEILPLSYDGPVTVRWNNLQAGLNSQAAWNNYDLDGTGTKIAIIDTGIDYTMQNLDDNYLGGHDFASIPEDDDPINNTFNEKHGTEVASVAVGEGVSNVVGTAYNGGYYALRIIDETGSGLISDLISAIEWASTEPHKADIISMSVGTYDQPGNPSWPTIKQQLETVCNNAYNKGITLVASSGNNGYPYAMYPAAFENVISAGSHTESQTIWNDAYGSSSGGVDVVAPGANVYTAAPGNSPLWVWGTSFATPHVSALIALQLQYAGKNNVELNNGFLWEVMKHSAVDLDANPTYQGSGKAWAAATDADDPNIGSIDLMAAHWPLKHNFQFSDYAFEDSNHPVYHIGADMHQSITLTNITNILGNNTETIENLNVTVTQVSCAGPNEPNLPGDSVKLFPTISSLEPGDANSLTLSCSYTIPPDTAPGLNKTRLELEFKFSGNSRVLKISYNDPNSFWYAAIPADLQLDNNVNFIDFGIFAQQWNRDDCNQPQWCGRADIDKNGSVDWPDLAILTENWLAPPIR